MECRYCRRVLKTKSSLKHHQKTTKYCLKLRGMLDKCLYNCYCCKKKFAQKAHLYDHLSICQQNTPYVNELKEEIRELKEQIVVLKRMNKSLEQDKKDLLKHSETIAKQPRYTQNNKINITQNLAIFNKTDEDIKKLVQENYNKDHLLEGQRGAARFTHNHVLKTKPGEKPIYMITDKSRGNGKYRVSPNETVIDNGMIGLSDKVIPTIRKKAAIIYRDDFENELIQSGFNELLQEDVSEFRNEMVKLYNKAVNKAVNRTVSKMLRNVVKRYPQIEDIDHIFVIED